MFAHTIFPTFEEVLKEASNFDMTNQSFVAGFKSVMGPVFDLQWLIKANSFAPKTLNLQNKESLQRSFETGRNAAYDRNSLLTSPSVFKDDMYFIGYTSTVYKRRIVSPDFLVNSKFEDRLSNLLVEISKPRTQSFKQEFDRAYLLGLCYASHILQRMQVFGYPEKLIEHFELKLKGYAVAERKKLADYIKKITTVSEETLKEISKLLNVCSTPGNVSLAPVSRVNSCLVTLSSTAYILVPLNAFNALGNNYLQTPGDIHFEDAHMMPEFNSSGSSGLDASMTESEEYSQMEEDSAISLGDEAEVEEVDYPPESFTPKPL